VPLFSCRPGFALAVMSPDRRRTAAVRARPLILLYKRRAFAGISSSSLHQCRASARMPDRSLERRVVLERAWLFGVMNAAH
jgi:hypothetical protein